MQRRLLAALAALALAAQAGEALAAFSIEEHVCCCLGREKNHRCSCPECARHRNAASGRCSIGGCASESGPLALANPTSPYHPAADVVEVESPAPLAPATFAPVFPLEPARDVPTPPPLSL